MRYFAFAILFVAFLAVSYGVNEINVCENVADGIFLADINNCSQYITCYYNKTNGPDPCPEGYEFSVSTQSCDPVGEAQCLPVCGANLSTYPYDKTCTKYVLCYDSKPIVRECLDGLQYNAEEGRCNRPEVVDCMANLCPPNDINNIVFLPSRSNCSNYFICYNGEPELQECSPDLVYNPERQGCDYKKNYNCTISATSRQVLSYSKQAPVRANIKCPSEGSHFIANENDNTSYFFCVNGSGVKLTCSPTLVYDRVKESCRDPSHVTK